MSFEYFKVTIDSYDKPMSSGRTKPSICRCSGKRYHMDGERIYENIEGCNFIIKPCTGEMTEKGRFCEFFTGILAQEFDLPVAKPAIVTIPVVFADIMKIDPGCCSISQFGCKFVDNPFLYIPGDCVFNSLNTAFEIFAFDMLIANSDRRKSNINLFYRNNQFTMFDHEMAFPMLFPLLGSDRPVEMGIKNAINHVLYKDLKGHDFNTNPFISRLKSLNDDKLSYICSVFPDEWFCDGYEKAIYHIKFVRDNADEFAALLEGTLQ